MSTVIEEGLRLLTVCAFLFQSKRSKYGGACRGEHMGGVHPPIFLRICSNLIQLMSMSYSMT